MRFAELRHRRTESQRRQTYDSPEDGGNSVVMQTQSRHSRRQKIDTADCSPSTDDKLASASYVRSAGASSIRAKKHSVQMLTVVVVLFFVCWTPTYVMQTWSVFDYDDAVAHVSPTAMNYVHLLAFVSSCCNPITYCFMSGKFRQGFVDAFRCRRRQGRGSRQLGRSRLNSAQHSLRHHDRDVGTRSSLMMTTRVHRAMTTTSALNEHDAVVSHHL